MSRNKSHFQVKLSKINTDSWGLILLFSSPCDHLPLFFCSMLSCLSSVSLSSLSRTSSIFSSVLSSWSCFSCARAFSMATLSRPCLETHRRTSTGYTLNIKHGRCLSSSTTREKPYFSLPPNLVLVFAFWWHFNKESVFLNFKVNNNSKWARVNIKDEHLPAKDQKHLSSSSGIIWVLCFTLLYKPGFSQTGKDEALKRRFLAH